MSKSATQCAYSSYRRRRYSRERTSYSLGVWGIDTPSPLPTRSWVNRRNEYRSGNRRYGKEHDAGTRGRDSDPRMRAARDGRQMPPTDLREARLRLRVVLISEHVRFTTTQAALTWKTLEGIFQENRSSHDVFRTSLAISGPMVRVAKLHVCGKRASQGTRFVLNVSFRAVLRRISSALIWARFRQFC